MCTCATVCVCGCTCLCIIMCVFVGSGLATNGKGVGNHKVAQWGMGNGLSQLPTNRLHDINWVHSTLHLMYT